MSHTTVPTGAVSFANGLSLELVQTGDRFLGLGDIRCGGVPLRAGRLPMFVEIRNPDGIAITEYRLAGRESRDGGERLTFALSARQGGPMEWQLHECRRCLAITDWSRGEAALPNTALTLDLRPVSRRIGGDDYQGFSYQYRYASDRVPIYQILDRGTWEIGGRAGGNAFWMRNCFAPATYVAGALDEHYSTEWYLPTCANPHIFQFLPLQTELQGFAFQAAAAGILCIWPTEVAHVRSLFEKPRGVDEFWHLHEHSGDLGLEFTTAPMEVLFSPGARDEVGRANAHGAVFDLVADTLHAQLGMRRERVTPYGIIEEWGDADLPLYREEGLPALIDRGVQSVEISNHNQNNMNTYGVSNMCCTVDYRIAESVGEEHFAAFCAAASDAGARVWMWANTALSTLDVLLDKKNGRPKRIDFLPAEDTVMEALATAEAPFVRNTFGAIEADHYTPSFAVLNLRDPVVRAYWLRRWGHLRALGLGGIFLDSSFNLSSDKFHYVCNAESARHGGTADQVHLLGNVRPETRPAAQILSQYRAHLDLMAAMQRMGYVYCNEDLGVFGIHRHGPAPVTRLANLWLWADCITQFDARAIRKAGLDPEAVFFQGLAYRMMWGLTWHVPSREVSLTGNAPRDDDDRPSARQCALLRTFARVEAQMQRREILPNGQGVRYHGPRAQVLWVFTDFTLALASPRTVRAYPDDTAQQTDCLQAGRNTVYVIEE